MTADAATSDTYATAPEDALEPALRGLVEESGAVAGAVCLFDPGEGVLRLAAEIGLSDDGCRLLRAVRPGVSPWEAPLVALLEQQTLVLEADAGAELPPLANSSSSASTVACLPLYADGRPRGSVILVASRAGAFAPDALEDLGPALSEIEGVVEDIHRRVAAIALRNVESGWGVDTITDLALRGVGPFAREVGRVLHSLRRLPGAETLLQAGRVIERITSGTPIGTDRVRQLEESVYALEAECRHLEAAGFQRLVEAEGRWQARVDEAEAARVRDQERIRALERTQERLAGQLEESITRERRARQDLTAAIERGAADREETLRHAQELAWTAEQRRAAASTEAESARAALGTAETSMMRLSEEARQARAEVARLAAAEQAARAARDHAQEALEEVRRREEASAERAHRFEADIETLRVECRRLETSARDLETSVEARWRSRLAETERAWAADRQRLDTLEGEHARTLTQLEEITVLERRVREQLDLSVSRSDSDREGILQRAHEITQKTEEARVAAVAELQAVREDLADAQAVILHMQESYALTERGVADREETLRYALELKQKSDEARTAAAAETESVRTALANVQGLILDAEEEARRARAEAERVTAGAQGAFAARQRSESLVDEARKREGELRTRAGELDQEVRTLREECQRLETAARARQTETNTSWEARVAEFEAGAARERSRARDLERDIDRKAGELEAAHERERQAVAELAAMRDRSAYDREDILGRALELTQAAEEARATAVAETENLRTALATAQGLMLEAEDESRRARGEKERLEAEAQAALAERQQATRALEDARTRQAEAAERLAQVEAELARLREEHQRQLATPERRPPAKPAVPPAPARAAKPAPAAAAAAAWSPGSGPRVIAVIDAAAWEGVRGPERHLEVLPPGPELIGRLAALAPARILVNLASPGGFEAIASLRAGGCVARFWGYLGAPGADRVLALGMIEAASHPIDADGLLAVLASYATRGTRVLTAGGDANALISLRQALTRDGMSVSIAWDAKQAGDLLTMVRPDVVIIDLGLPPRGGYGIVAELAAVKPLPTALLVVRGDDAAAGFAAALADRIRGEHALTRELLVDRVLRGREDPPLPQK